MAQKYYPGPCGARMHARSADGTLHTADFFSVSPLHSEPRE